MSRIIYKRAFTQYVVLILVVILLLSPLLASAALGSIFGSHAREGTPAEAEGGVAGSAPAIGGEPTGFGCANVPMFRQNLEPWASISYGCGDSTISSSGCGVTAAAMVLKFYGKDVTPATMAQYSLAHGYRPCGQGTAHGFFKSVASQYGLQESDNISWDNVLKGLANGMPVIVSGKGSAPFTGGGHYIVLTCRNADGTISVNDPYRGFGVYSEHVIRDQHYFSAFIHR